MTSPHDWPFEDPPETLCITTPEVLTGDADVCWAWPDDEEGRYWSFMQASTPERVSSTTLQVLLELDPTLADIGPVPLGWYAHREHRGALWQKSPLPGKPASSGERAGE
jgi:hypothetical protein